MRLILFTASFLTTVVALLHTRWEYRVRGRLSLFGVFLLCAMLFIPNLILHREMNYRPPEEPLEYLGLLLATAGLVICIVGIGSFRSLRKMFCLDTGELTTSGPYRWSRNPQYAGYFVFLVGFSLTHWTAWCFATLLLVAVSLHLLVRVEEEHLLRVFGTPYAEFCQKVPRYLGSSSRS